MLKIFKPAQKLALFFLDIFFPIECLGCGQANEWLCADCFAKIAWRSVQTCPACHKPNFWGEYCDNCYSELDGIMVAGSYQDHLLRQAIKTYKYRLVKKLSEPLTNLLIIFLGRQLTANTPIARHKALPKFLEYFDQAIVIPVPLAKRRLAWRGFNQAELLAKPVANFFNLSFSRQLVRIKHRQPQVELNRLKRQANIKDCFVWQAGQNLKGKLILLVDDIATTGATLNECAKVLKQQGANEVWGLVLAKN